MILEYLGAVMAKNEFVEFYDKYKISPVSQDISDIQLHIKRRKRLYQLIGINPESFANARILEVGAGSGYNTLVFLLVGAKVDIVEPNPTGRETMKELFCKYNINPSQYRIYDCVIEQFVSENEYDFVIAEGFLPIFNREQRETIISQLFKHTRIGGYCVVTTSCEISYFFEYLRVILGLILTQGISDFNSKTDKLIEAFSTHLKALKFASRPIKDWVRDSILNPTNDNFSFSMSDSVKEVKNILKGAFEVVGTSPALVANLSWYKDMEYSYGDQIVRDFPSKHHLLLCTAFKDSSRDSNKNNILLDRMMALRTMIGQYRRGGDNCLVEILNLLQLIVDENEDLGEFFTENVKEVIALLKNYKEITSEKISNAKFANAWGRGMQYMCFKKLDKRMKKEQ